MKKLLLEINGSVAKIIFNKEKSLNSLDKEIIEQLINYLNICEKDESIRVIGITGKGNSFCSGQDLKEPMNSDFNVEETLFERYNPMALKLREVEKPIIAGVDGICVGAGASIALGCDVLVASLSSYFSLSFSHIGLIPDAGGSYIFPKTLGFHKAMSMCMYGDKLSSSEALAKGIVYQVYEDKIFSEKFDQLLEKTSKMPTQSFIHLKKLINSSYNQDLERQLKQEAKSQIELLGSEDLKEGIMAFLQKRKPNFKGK